MKKKICIITAGILPVPDTKGGAIERLVTMIAEDNEKYNRMNLTIVGCYEENAVNIQATFTHTNFVNLQPKLINETLEKYIGKTRWHIREWLGYDYHYRGSYPYLVDQYLKNNGKIFDLIVSEGYDYEAMSSISRLLGKEKICWHLHMNPPVNSRTEKIYGNCIAVSDYIIDKFRNQSKMPIESTATIFNGIDTEAFTKRISIQERYKLRAQFGFNEDDMVIIFCGRIVEVKGVKELIQAILKVNNPNIKLLILGSSNFGEGDKGSYPQEVKRIVSEHSDVIKFTGFINNNEVYKYHQIADVGVVPSTYNDPCPLSLFEMITSQLPTIATAAGGMVEIGTNETTIFVKLEEIVEELTNAIKYLYDNPAARKRMAEAAKIRSEYFKRDRFYNDFCNIILNFINKDE